MPIQQYILSSDLSQVYLHKGEGRQRQAWNKDLHSFLYILGQSDQYSQDQNPVRNFSDKAVRQ